MKLFERFDKVYCLNLKKRVDRLNSFNEQVNKYDLGKFEVFDAVDGSQINEKHGRLNCGEIGHIHSTINMIELSIKNNYQKILLIEDDCIFKDEIRNVDSYFQLVPNDWDMLYFGGNHQLQYETTLPNKINDKVIKLQNTFTSHCVAIKNNLFPIILSELKLFRRQTDVVYRDIQKKYNVYSFFPSLATQSPGFSDIQNHNVNYNGVIV